MQVVVAQNTDRCSGSKQFTDRSQHRRRFGAAIDQVAREGEQGGRQARAGPVAPRVPAPAQAVEQGQQLLGAAVHVADEMQLPPVPPRPGHVDGGVQAGTRLGPRGGVGSERDDVHGRAGPFPGVAQPSLQVVGQPARLAHEQTILGTGAPVTTPKEGVGQRRIAAQARAGIVGILDGPREDRQEIAPRPPSPRPQGGSGGLGRHDQGVAGLHLGHVHRRRFMVVDARTSSWPRTASTAAASRSPCGSRRR